MEQKERISLADAEALIGRAMMAQGVTAEHAAAVAGALVAAEAEGQVGHGFSRVEDYAAQVRSGKINPGAQVSTRAVGTTALHTDADFGFAYPAMDQAIDAGIHRAQAHGTASMAISNSHHCGALSVQVEKLARAGLVGMMVANAPAAMAPWGSNTPVFGTNPIAFAAPRAEGPPLVIDLSLSRVARGKVMHARKSGQPIPEGWALDKDGVPTTDPEAALAGSMLPIGEAKGTALALMVEILASVFTGATSSSEMSSFFSADGPPPACGQFLMALKPAEPEAFTARMEALLSVITGLEGTRLPGTRRASAIAAAHAGGIEVPRSYLDIARKLAGDND